METRRVWNGDLRSLRARWVWGFLGTVEIPRGSALTFLHVNPPSARPIVNLGAHLLRALPLYRPRASLGGLFQAYHEGRSRMRTPHSRLDWPNPRVPLLSRGDAYSSGCGASGRLPGVSRLAVLVS